MLLKAGHLEVTYENGFLRYFTVVGQEVLRMIYFAVRDRDWNTIPGTILNQEINSTENSFNISYRFYVREGDIQMDWEVKIKGLPDSTIVFDIHGKVLHTFLKNRLGFCVLHPIAGIAGKPCLVEHSNGTTTQTTFPTYIHPYQPFKDIKSMQWQAIDGTTLHLAFEGDVFETEDHRNWTDTSYKTYCTPLDLPFPVEVKQGTEIQQSCTLRVLNVESNPRKTGHDNHINIWLTKQTVPFPKIGIGQDPENEILTENEIQFLKNAGFSHLRADVFLNEADWQEKVQKVVKQSLALEISIELALFFGDTAGDEALKLLSLLSTHAATISQMLLFDASSRLTSTALLKKIVPAIRLAMPGCKIGGGTDANFAELNRHTFDYSLVDFITYSANPQVHAYDNLTLIENISAQGDTILSARKLTAGKPVHISPVTLKPRFNAVATSGKSNPVPPADSRQLTEFVAGWTLGSLKYCSEAGASSITYFETTGIRGLCSATTVYPSGKLLEFILNKNPLSVRVSHSSHPLKVSSLVLESDSTYLLLANHTPDEEVVILPDSVQIEAMYFVINQQNRASKIDNTISLLPYAVVALQISLLSVRVN